MEILSLGRCSTCCRGLTRSQEGSVGPGAAVGKRKCRANELGLRRCERWQREGGGCGASMKICPWPVAQCLWRVESWENAIAESEGPLSGGNAVQYCIVGFLCRRGRTMPAWVERCLHNFGHAGRLFIFFPAPPSVRVARSSHF
jgi:hypothetical protein